MENNIQYKLLDYWDERYKTEEHFEWFGEYARFRAVIQKIVAPSSRILVLGCGNSKMSEEMYRDKYENIVNMDYSSVIIDLMQQRYQASMPRMSWLVMDIHEMTFESNSFDCVLEKGTLDALLVDERDPWNLSEENAVKMDRILERISDMLKDDGVFISITFAQPHFRKPVYALDKYNWSIEQFTVGETFHYFIYVMKKGGRLNPADKFFYCRQAFDAKSKVAVTLEDDANENYLLDIESSG